MGKFISRLIDSVGGIIGGVFVAAAVLGYFMNFQNLFEYDGGQELIVSAVGIFVFPIGMVTGWIW